MHQSIIIISTIFIAIIQASPFLNIQPLQENLEYRLPSTINPNHYDIEITPYFNISDENKRFTFDGICTITLLTTENGVNEIVLHANNLNINYETMELKTLLATEPLTFNNYNIDTHKLTLSVGSALTPNVMYKLKFEYSGQMLDDMEGFYRSSYIENGEKKWLGATQMQATSARRVFPCFDEPSFKATFTLTIKRPFNYQTIANTRMETSEMEGDLMVERFMTTPIMSTYLLAFIVSEFDGRLTNDQTFGVYARPDAYHQTEYAFYFGQTVLNALNIWLDFDYYSVGNVDKMYMAAIPDFAAGAMENWGLLTYRETAILYDAEVSTAAAKQRVATVITHEQAHMWFGDLVTCHWWEFTWLNEGFARYFQYFLTHMVQADWDLDLQYEVEQIRVVFIMDALETTHPLTHSVNTPSEISAIFDNISYNKGSAIIRMIEHIMGSQNFQNSLRNYLKDNAFSSTIPEKLYTALDQQTDEDIANIMNLWTTQSGYPVVFVDVQPNRMSARITQKRFLINNKDHSESTAWDIPLNFAHNNQLSFDNTLPTKWLKNTEASIVEEFGTEISWIICNLKQTGYYRVNYDDVTWGYIEGALKSNRYSDIHVLNRAQVIDDVMNLARAGYIQYDVALPIFDYLRNEDHYIPWYAALNAMSFIITRSPFIEELESLQSYFLDLIRNVYMKLGFYEKINDTHLDTLNRMNILSFACKHGHENCVATAKLEFNKLREDANYRVPNNLRPVVYCTGIAEGDKTDWDYLWDRYLNEQNAAEQTVILTALGCTNNTDQLRTFVDNILSENVRLQDKLAALTAAYTGRKRNSLNVMLHVLEPEIYKKLSELGYLKSIISGLMERITHPVEIVLIEIFIPDLENPELIINGLNEAEININWTENNMPTIKEIIARLMYKQKEIKYRLPKNIEPISYQIELTPYFENDMKPFTFDGTVEIVLKINEYVNEIVLHKDNLNIIETSLLRGSIDIEIIHEEYIEDTQTLHLRTGETLQMDETYILHFGFIGEINEEMAGFYRSSYQDVNGITKWLATTQMQPTSARKVFPCFDEPSFKATFNVIINRPTSYQPTISNTKLLDTYVPAGSNRTRETFATTPKMSTYLLAFIVSEFEHNTDDKFSVYARPEAIQQTTYAVDVGVKLLNELGKWLDYEYNSVREIEKMDMAAIPDFSAGAMENWGLLTYRETAVLYAENTSTAKAKQRVAGVIAHEQSHLWFGDLVTCDWWKYTWLNEGFARYFQYFGTALVEKDWNLDLQYVVEQIHSVFAIDALKTTHPMTNDVITQSEISGIFDSISYSKGSAIIRMIEHLMGSEKFQIALREYIKEREFKTTTPENLYEHLKNHADPLINIDLIMDSWTTQSGYPVITVEVQPNKQNVLVRQDHFIINSNNNDHNLDTTWFIPLNYVTQLSPDFTNTQSKEILRNTEKSKEINIGQNINWIIFNVQQTGYYRVNYDTENWNNIGNALKSPNHDGIHIINRAQIIDDVMNLARAKLIDYYTVFSILAYLENEEHYVPWSAAFNNLAFILNRMNDDELLTGKKYILKLIGNIYNKLGFDENTDDSHIDILNRELVLTYACKYGHEECIRKSKELYAKLVDDKIEVPPNVRSVVYCTAIANGGISEWNFFYDKFKNSNVAAEQSVILTALGCSKDANIIREYISKIINTNDIRQQDKIAAFTATYTGDVNNVDLVIDVIKSNFQIIHAKLNVYSLLTGLASRIRNIKQYNEINAILKSHDYDNSNKGLNNAINDAEYNIYASNIGTIMQLMTEYINSMAATITSYSLLFIVSLITLSNYFI